MKTPEVIYLIDMGDEIAWCDDESPSGNEEGSVKYFRADTVTGDDGKELDLHVALSNLLDRYTELVNCGDCGNWNPETEDCVIEARKALGDTDDGS